MTGFDSDQGEGNPDPTFDVITFKANDSELEQGVDYGFTDNGDGTASLQWTPQSAHVGSAHIELVITDWTGASTSYCLDVQVDDGSVPTDLPKFITHAMGPAYTGETWEYKVKATDLDGSGNDKSGDLEYSLDSCCPTDMHLEMIVDPDLGYCAKVTWTPDEPTDPSELGQHVVINVNDGENPDVPQGFYLPVVKATPDNDPPEFLTQYLGPMTKDCLFQFPLDIKDKNGHDFTVTLVDTTAPEFTSANITSDGKINWTPTTGGNFTITLIATDEYGVSSLPVTYPFHVFSNANPYFTGDNGDSVFNFIEPARLGREFSYSIEIHDPNLGDQITVELDKSLDLYSNSCLEDFQTDLTYDAGGFWNLEITWNVPDAEHIENIPGAVLGNLPVKVVPIRILAYDDQGGQAQPLRFDLPVYDPDDPRSPLVVDEAITIRADQKFEFQVDVQVPSGKSLEYTLLPTDETPTLPEGISMTSDGFITWTPTITQANKAYKLAVQVDDGVTTPSIMTLNIFVAKPEDFEVNAPTINSSHPTGATAGQELVYEPTAIITKDEGIVEVTSGLQWFLGVPEEIKDEIDININTGRVTWIPKEEQIGRSYGIEICVVDSNNASDTQSFILTVGGVNQLPTIDNKMFPLTCRDNLDFNYPILASDPEGHALSYKLEPVSGNFPSGMEIDSETGLIHWDSEYIVTGFYSFSVKVSEKYYPSSYVAKTITLEAVGNGVNCEPLILETPGNQCAIVGQEYTYPFEVWDLEDSFGDNDGFTWEIVSGGSGDMGIDINSGEFTWTPLEGEEGEHTIEISVTDDPITHGNSITRAVTFTLNVIKSDSPQVASTATADTVAGTTLYYQVEASDPQGGPMTFAIDRNDPDAQNVPDVDEMGIWWDSGLLVWIVPEDLGSDLEVVVPIVVAGKYGATSTQYLTINASKDDTIAPTINTRVVEAEIYDDGGIKNIIRTVLPDEELDANIHKKGGEKNIGYVLIVDIADNSGKVGSSNGEDSEDPLDDDTYITAVDVAALEISDEYNAIYEHLSYGHTEICFTLGGDALVGGTGPDEDGLNQGNVHFKLKATDEKGNSTTCDLTYYAQDSSEDPPAKILEFRTIESEDAEEPVALDVRKQITEPVNVYGIADLWDSQYDKPFNYELILYRADGDYCDITYDTAEDKYSIKSQADHVLLKRGEAIVGGDTLTSPLGTIDPTLYGSGMYRLVLAITCNCGGNHYKAVDERIIEIRNDAKPSSLDLSFNDLQVDLGGIPVSLTRAYSSADVNFGPGDFGPGWSLDFLNAGIQVAHFNKVTNSLQEAMASGTRVLVTLPDGSIQRFSFAPQQIGSSDQYTVHFEPDQDVTSTLEIIGVDYQLRLSPVVDPEDSSSYQGTYAVPNTNQNFIPHLFGGAFVLRTQTGLEYLYDTKTGELQAIRDDAGRRIDITQESVNTTKIESKASGQEIVITRDTEGRISKIKDLNTEEDKYLEYKYGSYDESGSLIEVGNNNLGMVILRDGSKIRYGYCEATKVDEGTQEQVLIFPHHLTAIYDDTNVPVLTAEYGEHQEDIEGTEVREDKQFGHLIHLEDAGGQKADLSCRSLGNGKTLTKTQNEQGILVEEIHNSRGDVLRHIQALDSSDVASEDRRYLVTIYQYDSMQGLLTKESLPFVVTGESDRFLEDVDLQTGEYSGEITWARDLEYIPGTKLLKISKDALGNPTEYEYDDQDRIIATTANGKTTHNIYESNTGNLLETYVTIEGDETTEYNHIRYEYDHWKLTDTYRVDTDGTEIRISSSTYYSNGRLASTTDATDVTRYYVYDYNGNQTVSYYHWKDDPDFPTIFKTIIDRTDYDSEGRVTGTSQHEVSGHIAITGTGMNDGDFYVSGGGLASNVNTLWTTETSYNTRGLVSSTTDRYDIETINIYNDAGNTIETRTEVKDESTGNTDGWLISRTIYDDQGRVEFVTDPYFVKESDYANDSHKPSDPNDVVHGTFMEYDNLGHVTLTEQYQGLMVTISGDSIASYYNNVKPGDVDAISSNQTFYDDFGRVDYTIDEFGTKTKHVYNALGQEVETLYQSWDDSQPEGDERCWIVTRTVYDNFGRTLATSDPYVVYVSESAYNTPPVAAEMTDPCYVTYNEYDELGRVTKTDRCKWEIVVTGDSAPYDSDLVGTAAASIIWTTETVYNALGQVAYSVDRHAPDEEGPRTDYIYDAQGRQIATIDPLVVDDEGHAVYHYQGQPLRLMSKSVYEGDRLIETIENIKVVAIPDETSGLLDRNSLTEYNSEKQTTAYEYDAYGRTIKTTKTSAVADSLSISTQTCYDDFGRVIAESDPFDTKDPSGNDRDIDWSDTYDSFIDTVDNSVIPTKCYEYNTTGKLAAVILPKVEHPDTGVMVHPRYEYTYNEYGNQVSIRDNICQTDLNDSATIYYDHDGTAGDDTRVTLFTYDSQGHEKSRTLPIGVGTTDPDDFIEEKFYDCYGNLDSEITFEGVTIDYVYDYDEPDGDPLNPGDSGRLIRKEFSKDSQTDIFTYDYDAFGRTFEVVQSFDSGATSWTETTTYTDFGQVESIASASGTKDYGSINYEYDLVSGQRTRTYVSHDADGDPETPEVVITTDTSYTYDTLDRLSTVTDTDDATTSYEYDIAGNLTRMLQPGYVVTDYIYDELNRLNIQRTWRATDSNLDTVDALLAEFDYTVRADGKRTEVHEKQLDPSDSMIDEAITSWDYDALGRLIEETFDFDADGVDRIDTYKYDLASNRTEKLIDANANGVYDVATDTKTSYLYDANDCLETETTYAPDTVDDRYTIYGYNGTQQTSKTVKLDTDGSGGTLETTEYDYNLQGRMSEVRVDLDADGNVDRVEEYTYNDSSIRVSKTLSIDTNDNDDFTDADDTNAKKTIYLIDPHNHTGYAQVLEELDAETAAVLRRYTIGHDVLSQWDSTSSTLFFLYDGHGSTRGLVNSSGQIAMNTSVTPSSPQIFRYDAFGNRLDLNAALTTILYSGEWTDTTGLQYLRARYYDSNVGRFNRLDPYAGDMQDPASLHKYLYCVDDPINMIDPSGNFGMVGVGVSVGIGTMLTAKGLGYSWGQSAAIGAGFGLATLFGIAAISTHFASGAAAAVPLVYGGTASVLHAVSTASMAASATAFTGAAFYAGINFNIMYYNPSKARQLNREFIKKFRQKYSANDPAVVNSASETIAKLLDMASTTRPANNNPLNVIYGRLGFSENCICGDWVVDVWKKFDDTILTTSSQKDDLEKLGIELNVCEWDSRGGNVHYTIEITLGGTGGVEEYEIDDGWEGHIIGSPYPREVMERWGKPRPQGGYKWESL